MVNIVLVDEILAGLEELDFYPSDPNKRLRILRTVCEMAEDDEQVRWLVRRALRVFGEWPGMEELRGLFTSRFRPRDGYEGKRSKIYPDGFPADPELARHAGLVTGGAPRAELPPGETVAEVPLVDPSQLPVKTLPPPRPVKLLPGENELQALARACEEARREEAWRAGKKPPLPTDDEIAAIKRAQAERAGEQTTRDILEGKTKAAGGGGES